MFTELFGCEWFGRYLSCTHLGNFSSCPTCRSNQIVKNSVYRYRGPIPIDLFCSLIFMPFVTEIELNKVCPLFPLDSRQILANRVPLNVWGGGCCIFGANRAGKSTRSLFNCISVMDGIKINEQYKSIGIGPLYLQSEFEAI